MHHALWGAVLPGQTGSGPTRWALSVRQPGLQSVNSLPYVLTGPPFKPQNREEVSKTLRLEVKERKDGVVRMP